MAALHSFPPLAFTPPAFLIARGGGWVRYRRAGGECKNEWGGRTAFEYEPQSSQRYTEDGKNG
jgi:hypothetical protein